jgi:hypothetical protein
MPTQATSLRRMILRSVEIADFRHNEVSNLVLSMEKGLTLRHADHVVLFVSRKGDQLVFVHGPGFVSSPRGVRRVFHSEKLRLESGRWNPMMLADYARQVGISLVGAREYVNDHQQKAIVAVIRSMIEDLERASARFNKRARRRAA